MNPPFFIQLKNEVEKVFS